MSSTNFSDLTQADHEIAHTGHYYNCPNGHLFVIGEVKVQHSSFNNVSKFNCQCGGAMQQATCPECGEAVGGTGHNLTSTNTRASDFEDLARRHGAQRSPWAWAG